MVGLVGSGKSRTCRPLASRYSVTPSTCVTRATPGGILTDAGARCASAGADAANADTRQARRNGLVTKDSGISQTGIALSCIARAAILPRSVRAARLMFEESTHPRCHLARHLVSDPV